MVPLWQRVWVVHSLGGADAHSPPDVPSVMLDTQYRMHPAIAAFPSRAFYNDELKNGTVSDSGDISPAYSPPETSYLYDEHGRHRNVMFVDHDFPETLENQSLANYGDAERVADIVVDLLYNNPVSRSLTFTCTFSPCLAVCTPEISLINHLQSLRGKDIGVIAPYAAQIRLLHQYLYSDPSRAAAMVDILGVERAMEIPDIEIKTVDGFEGREKEVIVFSTVRSNEGNWVGFLADWRRLNVGITRAKRVSIRRSSYHLLFDHATMHPMTTTRMKWRLTHAHTPGATP